MATNGYSKQSKERPDLGPCPKCAADGIGSRLRLFKGRDKADNRRFYEFAACELGKDECGYRQETRNGKLVELTPCPRCHQLRKQITKKDGSHVLRCDSCNLWFLADRDFNVVEAPRCRQCGAVMVHRVKKDYPDEYFWACFEHQEYIDSDKYGAVCESNQKLQR